MNPKHHPSERGQALILIVFGFIVLLGFTALAVDGGMLYSDRRYAQNVADASALAAAADAALSLENNAITYDDWNCSSSEIFSASAVARTAAISRATTNDIALDPDISDGHGVDINCGVDTSGSTPDKYLDITVKVTMETNTSFAHLVYSGALVNTVESIARVRPRENSPEGLGETSILGLDPEPGCDPSTVKFHGGGKVDIRGGGNVISNGCVRFNGTPNVIVRNGGGVYYVSDRFGNVHSDPLEQQISTTVDPTTFHRPAPDCASLDVRTNNGGTLDPGRYTDLRFNNGTHHLNPGLYCVANELHWNGGTITGDGVTIYVESGYLTINGNVNAQISAPGAMQAASWVAPAVPGLLFYLPPTNSNPVQLNGTSETTYTGVVLAPASQIAIEGTGYILAYRTMLVGWQVVAGGNSDTYIKYYDNNLFTLTVPTRMELYR